MKKVNIRELAQVLNISVATVSKALRDSHEISAETKKKVVEMAALLNYTPNPHASSLRKKNSKTIGVILPKVADNFFSLAINGIQSIAESKGYHLLIYLSHDKFINEKLIVADCGSGRVDGILISISGDTETAEHLRQLNEENIPIVFFDRDFDGFDTARVITNDRECGYMAGKHLVEKGMQRPVFLSISSSLPICKERAEGFEQAIRESGIVASPAYQPVLYCEGSDEAIFEQIKTIISQQDGPDAVVASVEKIALQVYMACQELGIHIPAALKVIAFSTLETAPILNPSLTTITQPAFEIGKTAAEILFKGIEKKNFDLKGEKIILPSRLIERASTQ
ncbi:MAG: substrate-binding domain-containing protein [Terrimonas sp.]|nr:substrate-binding domain-containing protein [Terrimonas sp.]